MKNKKVFVLSFFVYKNKIIHKYYYDTKNYNDDTWIHNDGIWNKLYNYIH